MEIREIFSHSKTANAGDKMSQQTISFVILYLEHIWNDCINSKRNPLTIQFHNFLHLLYNKSEHLYITNPFYFQMGSILFCMNEVYYRKQSAPAYNVQAVKT